MVGLNSIVGRPGVVCILILIPLPHEGLPGKRSESLTQMTSCEPSPNKSRYLGTNHWARSRQDFQVREGKRRGFWTRSTWRTVCS